MARLTVRQRRYIKGIRDGLPKYQAAVEAGYPETSARNPKFAIESAAGMRRALGRMFEQEGISNAQLRISDQDVI